MWRIHSHPRHYIEVFGEESPVPPEQEADWFPEVIWTLWRRENAIAWTVNWTTPFLSWTYWWLLTSVTFTSMDYTAIPFSCGIKQWHVCAIRVARLLRVKSSGGASAVADIIVVRPWLNHLDCLSGNSVMNTSFELRFSVFSAKAYYWVYLSDLISRASIWQTFWNIWKRH